MKNISKYQDLSNNELTMSSRELLDMINSVRSDENENPIRVNDFHAKVADELDNTNYEKIVVQNFNNTTSIYFLLDRDQCLLVGMRESKKVRRIVLELLKNKFNQNQFNIPQTMPEALRLAAEVIEENIQLNEKIAVDAPKVAFMNRFIEIGTTKSLRETAKILKMPEQAMINTLISDGILFRQGNALPYAQFIKNGCFEVKTGEANGHAYTQTRVTTKGISFIAKRYASELMVA